MSARPDLQLFAVGDLQLMTREPPADLFEQVTPTLSAADITFGNCEWPYAEESGDTHPIEAHINDDFDGGDLFAPGAPESRSEEHTSELQSLMRNSYAGLRLKTKTQY